MEAQLTVMQQSRVQIRPPPSPRQTVSVPRRVATWMHSTVGWPLRGSRATQKISKSGTYLGKHIYLRVRIPYRTETWRLDNAFQTLAIRITWIAAWGSGPEMYPCDEESLQLLVIAADSVLAVYILVHTLTR
jgi:hypothetical protein